MAVNGGYVGHVERCEAVPTTARWHLSSGVGHGGPPRIDPDLGWACKNFVLIIFNADDKGLQSAEAGVPALLDPRRQRKAA